MEPAEALGRYPLSITIPVAWGEMDAFQHVNNVSYVRWLETGRIALQGEARELMRNEHVKRLYLGA